MAGLDPAISGGSAAIVSDGLCAGPCPVISGTDIAHRARGLAPSRLRRHCPGGDGANPMPDTLPQPTAAGTIHPEARIGHVHLKVADLDRALAFWRDVIGLE